MAQGIHVRKIMTKTSSCFTCLKITNQILKIKPAIRVFIKWLYIRMLCGYLFKTYQIVF